MFFFNQAMHINRSTRSILLITADSCYVGIDIFRLVLPLTQKP